MKAYQIFQAISPELARSIFQELREHHREIYKTTLTSLANQRRLRPVFVQRKSVPQQIEWLCKTSQLKAVDNLGENLLQVWLLQTKKKMLNQFLDALEIEHGEDGTVEKLPDELPDDLLAKAIEALLNDYPGEEVALYLHVFQLQQAGGWETLNERLRTDTRLHLPGLKRAESSAAEKSSPTAATPAASSQDDSETGESGETDDQAANASAAGSVEEHDAERIH